MTSETTAFLDYLFGNLPEEQHFLAWELPGKESGFFQTVAEAVTWIERRKTECDIYVGVGLRRHDLGAAKRGGAEDVSGIVGIGAEVDIAHAVHKKGALPPDEAAARALLERMPLRPTLVVHSGHGIQAWWLFQEAYLFDDASDRGRVQAILTGWSDLLRERAKEHGWEIDSVWDLARVLRVPGTTNQKHIPVPVRLLSEDGPRYAGPSDFADYVKARRASPSPAKNDDGAAFTLDADAAPPFAKWRALMENDPKFRQTWERKRRDLQDQSASGYCMSLANIGVQAGWTDQEIVNTLIAWRREQHEDLKLARPDWYTRTVNRAQERTRQAEALTMLADGEVDGDDQEAVIETIRNALKVPIAGWIQCGQDQALYSMRLEDGSEIAIGDVDAVMSPIRFRNRLYKAGYLPPRIKAERWDGIARQLLSIAEVVDSGENTRPALLEEWLVGFLARTPPCGDEDWESALSDNQPFIRDSVLYIHAGALRRYVIFNALEQIKRAELLDILRGAGFSRRQVSGRVEGEVITRNYWCAPYIGERGD